MENFQICFWQPFHLLKVSKNNHLIQEIWFRKWEQKKKNEKGEQTTNTPHIHFTITLRHLTHSLHFKKRLFSASATFQLHPDANFERFVFQINFQTGRWLLLLTMRKNCLVKPWFKNSHFNSQIWTNKSFPSRLSIKLQKILYQKSPQ